MCVQLHPLSFTITPPPLPHSVPPWDLLVCVCPHALLTCLPLPSQRSRVVVSHLLFSLPTSLPAFARLACTFSLPRSCLLFPCGRNAVVALRPHAHLLFLCPILCPYRFNINSFYYHLSFLILFPLLSCLAFWVLNICPSPSYPVCLGFGLLRFCCVPTCLFPRLRLA